jgi:hypothetical protein
MTTAIGGLMTLLQALLMILYYGMMAVIILMLYKVSKEVGEIKRSILELQETVALSQLPRQTNPERSEDL